MSRFIIVRHGNTFAPGEPPRRIGSRTDLPLTNSGRRQAQALGVLFGTRGIVFARTLAGPLQRTRETAALILAHMGQPPAIEVAPWLTEIDHGPDEGRAEAAVLARLGEHALAAWDIDGVPPVGWTVDATARMRAWRAFFDAPADGITLLVTSNGAARFALLADAGLREHRPLKLCTGAFGEIERDPAGQLFLLGWDCRPEPSVQPTAVATRTPGG